MTLTVIEIAEKLNQTPEEIINLYKSYGIDIDVIKSRLAVINKKENNE